MEQDLVNRIIEAALLAANQPLTLAQLHALFPEDQPAPADSVEQALEALREDCAGRGIELVELASGFRYQVKADVHPWVARLWTERQTKYTRATLETLALIAYRQPITRGEIEQVRGVAVNSNIIKALEEREWIRVVGHRDVPGKPALFGTTKAFLDYFGLKRLDELPPLSELKDIGELEPQLPLDGEPIAAGGLGVENGSDAANADLAGAESDEAGSNPSNSSQSDSSQSDSNEAGSGEANPSKADSNEVDSNDVDEPVGGAEETGSETGAETASEAKPPYHDADVADDGVSSLADAANDSGDEPADADASAETHDTALPGDPEAAPGERAADANDPEQDQHAVETTTVPEFEAESDADARPEQQK